MRTENMTARELPEKLPDHVVLAACNAYDHAREYNDDDQSQWPAMYAALVAAFNLYAKASLAADAVGEPVACGLPDWFECERRVSNPSLNGCTALEEFIYHYDDADTDASGQFMRRVAAVIQEVADGQRSPAPQSQPVAVSDVLETMDRIPLSERKPAAPLGVWELAEDALDAALEYGEHRYESGSKAELARYRVIYHDAKDKLRAAIDAALNPAKGEGDG